MDIRVDQTILRATTKLQTINLSYRRGEVVYEKGALTQFVYVVTEGALFRFRLSGGRGQ
jgi:CRP-like cAMP-binding protein